MKNNAHIESKKQRLKRLKSNPPVEAIETLLNSIANFFNNEIIITPEKHQTSLLFIGIHAAALTISEALFGKKGVDGFRLFLEKFVDVDDDDNNRFSLIADSLHDWRNILAHQWIGSMGHEIQYDYEMKNGWEKTEFGIKVNPKIYCSSYLNAFSSIGRIWQYDEILNDDDLEKARQRIVKKYENR